MHEFSLMSQIIKVVLEEKEKHGLKDVEQVILEIGTLVFIGKEQMKNVFNIITKDTVLSNAQLIIEDREAKVSCSACGYSGGLEQKEFGNEEMHFNLPSFACPKCGGRITILEGRDCIVKNIIGTVEENSGEEEETGIGK